MFIIIEKMVYCHLSSLRQDFRSSLKVVFLSEFFASKSTLYHLVLFIEIAGWHLLLFFLFLEPDNIVQYAINYCSPI